MKRALHILLSLSLTVSAAAAWADEVQAPPALRQVDVTEHLGAQLPLDLAFVDETGKATTLGEAMSTAKGHGKPVILSLVYYKCPMLCSLLLSGVTKVMRDMDLKLGEDYEAVTVSFDPADTFAGAKTKQTNYLQSLGHPEATGAWKFLTGKPESIKKLTDDVGFKYYYDEQNQQFAHAAAIFILTPDGRISRYLYDVSFEPKQLKLALVEASAGTVGSTVDKVLLQCYKYDPASRKYHLYVFGFLRTGGLLVLIALSALIGYLFWHDPKRKWAS
jgi:protein SCO1/2